jgi:Tfp pilus assembly protein PilF
LAASARGSAQASRRWRLNFDAAEHRKLALGAACLAVLLIGAAGIRIFKLRNAASASHGQGHDASIALRHVPAPGAEDLYLQGRYFWSLRTADGLSKSINAFTQAIVKDPSYADAYAGLAESYDLLPEFANGGLDDSLLRAKDAADRAIALDPNLAAAHRAKAFAVYFRDWDIAGSDAEFQRALALDPGSAETHQWYASSLQCREEGAEALRQIDEARRLNPASPAIAAEAAYIQADFGDLGAGIRELKEIEQTQPSLSSPALYLAMIDFAIGDYPEYIASLRRYGSVTGSANDVALADAIAKGWAQGGKAGLLEARAKGLKAAFDHGSETAGFWLAETLLMLGRPKAALPYFRASLNARNIASTMLQECHWAKPLANDPDYAALFAEIRERQHGGYPHYPPMVPISLRLPN